MNEEPDWRSFHIDLKIVFCIRLNLYRSLLYHFERTFYRLILVFHFHSKTVSLLTVDDFHLLHGRNL